MRDAITAHGGHVFKTIGDAFCAAFATPEGAVAAAIDAQRALANADFSAVGGLRVRMALNTGTADERDGDYYGPALNRVARLLGLGHGGQVLVSSMTAVLVREDVPAGASLLDLGEHELRGLEGRERVYQLAGQDLPHDFPPLRSPRSDVPWLVPDAMRTQAFVGREQVLEQLRAQLTERHRAVISGLGGIGKTQTALEYAIRHRADYPAGVFWINAETTVGLSSGFAAIAKTPSVLGPDAHYNEQSVAAALKWLGANPGWLLILDNVEDRKDVLPFIPEGSPGDVLITSREPVFAELGIPRALQMPDLESADAVRLLLLRTGRNEAGAAERAAASELAHELGNLPLALDQAAAYIAETMTTFSAYVNAFRKRRLAVLERSGSEPVAHETVTVTWAANFEAVERASTASAEVLRFSALLAPDDIPFELFLGGAKALATPIADALQEETDDLAMAETLRPLARYSLIRLDAVSRVYSVHRLVQEMVWTTVPASQRKGYVDRAVAALDRVFPDVEYATWESCERLLPHVISIVRWIDAYEALSKAASRVLNGSGWYLWEQGRYAEARAFYERALSIVERVLGPDDPEVPRTLNNLANVYWSQGRYTEAQSLTERGLAIRERVLGANHPDVASSLNTLGLQYREHGRFEEAMVLLARALAIRELALGPEHPLVAHSLSNYANVLCDLGRYAEAQPLYERALEIRERALAPDHPDIAASLNNLAAVNADQGRYAQAQRLSERALAIAERTLGKDHPDVAIDMTNVAETYLRLGRFAEAESLFERARAIRESVLGPGHVLIADNLTGLAGVYVQTGRLSDAESLVEEAREIHRRAGDSNTLNAAKTLATFASLRKAQQRYAEALALLEEACAIEDPMLPHDHPELVELRDAIENLRAEQRVQHS